MYMKGYGSQHSTIAITICLAVAIGWVLVGTSISKADTLVSDNFESYTLNAWPSSNWVANANAVSDPTDNHIVVDPTNPSNKVLKLFGQNSSGASWAALAFTPCTFPSDFTLQALVRTGDEPMNGVQPFRGTISLRNGTDWPAWTNPVRDLLSFTQGGNIEGSDNTVLQSYNSDQWYDVAVNYHRDGTALTLHYWIDGVDRGSEQITILDLSAEESFDHVGLTAIQGSAYFDNLSVTPTPEPSSFALLALGGLLLLRRRKN